MIPEPPRGQGPVDPQGAFARPGGGAEPPLPVSMPDFNRPVGGASMQQQTQMPPGRSQAGPGFSAPGIGGAGRPPWMQSFPPYGPFPPTPPRRVWPTVLTTLLVLGLMGSLVLNAILVTFSGGSSRSAQSTVLKDGDPTQVVAVVPVTGVIMEGTADRFTKAMQQVDTDSNVKALVLAIDTPGGSVSASDHIYHRLELYRKDHPSVPVVVSMSGMATSGGYYVACGGQTLFAEPTTLTGNIGVLIPSYNVHDLAEKYGVKESTYAAPEGGMKNSGSMFGQAGERDRKYWQGLTNDMYARFTQVVQSGRGALLTKPLAEIADGRVYTTKDAISLGLVDKTGYLEDACAFAATKAALGAPKWVRYQPAPSLLELLMGESKSGVSPAGALGGSATGSVGVTVNGVKVDVDPAQLEVFRTPRLMSIWRE